MGATGRAHVTGRRAADITDPMALRRSDPDVFRARATELAWLTLVFFLAALFALVAFGAFRLETLLPAFAAAGVVLGVLAWRQARVDTLPPALRHPPFSEWAAAEAEESVSEDAPERNDDFHAARERMLHHIEERKRGLTAADATPGGGQARKKPAGSRRRAPR